MIVIDVFGILMFIGLSYFILMVIVGAEELFDILMRPLNKIRFRFFNSEKCVDRIMQKLSLDDETRAINKLIESVKNGVR